MNYYYKVNSRVAEIAGLTDERYHTSDDCYILWQGDMKQFGDPFYMDELVASIGALRLTPMEVKQEQEGITVHVLPEPTDERYSLDTTL